METSFNDCDMALIHSCVYFEPSHCHITSHWGTLTATDREVIVFTLLLLIDHFRYFVCRGLDVVTLPKFPLAFYGQTDPSFIPCLDDVPCQITFCW